MIQVKRVYEPPNERDGTRFLVDHLWPRGLKKEEVKMQSWEKDVSPSSQLRQWFGHDPDRWQEFQRRYFAELDQKPASWQRILETAEQGDITLVFSARDEQHNNAIALKNYLEKQLGLKLKRRTSRRQQHHAVSA